MYLICNRITRSQVTGLKVFAFSYRDFDEGEFFQQGAKEYGIELSYTADPPSLENCELVKGCPYVSVMTTPVNAELLDRFKELGVKMISTRSIGYNHIDVDHAKEIGIVVNHINYDSNGVAEFVVMDMLMAVRRIKEINARTMKGDFRLNGIMSEELRNKKVGIIGAGIIGIQVLRDLSGFGCELFYYNRSRKEEADRYAKYLSLEELLTTCDVISLHLELNAETHHFMDAEKLAKMKKGSILVNTSRGPVVDNKALIESLESGHLSAAALDVIEDEFNMYYMDRSDMDLTDHYIGKFRSMPNVIFSHHIAFYYRNAIMGMVLNSLRSLKALAEGEEVPYRVA